VSNLRRGGSASPTRLPRGSFAPSVRPAFEQTPPCPSINCFKCICPPSTTQESRQAANFLAFHSQRRQRQALRASRTLRSLPFSEYQGVSSTLAAQMLVPDETGFMENPFSHSVVLPRPGRAQHDLRALVSTRIVRARSASSSQRISVLEQFPRPCGVRRKGLETAATTTGHRSNDVALVGSNEPFGPRLGCKFRQSH